MRKILIIGFIGMILLNISIYASAEECQYNYGTPQPMLSFSGMQNGSNVYGEAIFGNTAINDQALHLKWSFGSNVAGCIQHFSLSYTINDSANVDLIGNNSVDISELPTEYLLLTQSGEDELFGEGTIMNLTLSVTYLARPTQTTTELTTRFTTVSVIYHQGVRPFWTLPVILGMVGAIVVLAIVIYYAMHLRKK